MQETMRPDGCATDRGQTGGQHIGENTRQVLVGVTTSEVIPLNMGLMQGSPLIPLLVKGRLLFQEANIC